MAEAERFLGAAPGTALYARVDALVMDEFHFYADRDRGMAWHVPHTLVRGIGVRRFARIRSVAVGTFESHVVKSRRRALSGA